MSTLRIMHIGTSGVPVTHPRGGAIQRRILEMAKVQASLGLEVTIASPAEANATRLIDGVRLEDIKLRLPRPARDYEFLLAVRRRLARCGAIDIVHAHGSPEAARVFHGRARAIVQSIDFFRYRATSTTLGRRYYAKSLNRFDALYPVSEYCAAQLQDYYPSISAPIEILYNGVNLEQFSPCLTAASDARTSLGLGAGPLVLYLGRVCEQKGSDLLGQLSKSLRDQVPDVTVVAAGPPDQFLRTGETPLTLSLHTAGVLCTGAVDESLLPGLLSAATVFVLPTRRDEMFGMAAVEAAACGTPAVASDLGGIPEAVGQGGLLFPVDDAKTLAQATLSLLEDGQLRQSYSEHAQSHARSFAWPRIVHRSIHLYRKALLNV